ncbi:MBL fold metallo-hydrolase [Granulosicoccus antarcticus]|uniref:Ribonuclease BN n=1 Tax=Granulosicoccus antarcticus IMCC3135 TaxID=1192854 RepID=A0A2Z2NUZ8_9GAMM|nr:MBL fold metallo-hydrolase [Granulosicoccus antarcticus]ASJ74335.1 Ribonuclease BN [Granulosicoccus antarcticus IMCC3135]
MIQRLRFTLLGTGSSGGVPRVGNQWGACDPSNTRNRRRRCSLLVESIQSEDIKTSVVIDTGADLREQLLSAEVDHLDGVLITHAHADHIFGMDDLRQLAINMRSSITVHMDTTTTQVVKQAFGYCFNQAPGSSYPPFCNLGHIEHGQSTIIEGAGGSIEALPLLAEHGDIHALGFRIGDVAYLPDMKRITDEASLAALQGVRVLIVDALRYKHHPTHMNLEDCLAFIDSIKPESAVLTNMHSDMDYDELCQNLPPHIRPGYDGLQLS